MTSVVNNIYFSDLDAVKVLLRFRWNNQDDVDFNTSVWISSNQKGQNHRFIILSENKEISKLNLHLAYLATINFYTPLIFEQIIFAPLANSNS